MFANITDRYWHAIQRLGKSGAGNALARALVPATADNVWQGFRPTTRDIADVSLNGCRVDRARLIDMATPILEKHGVVVLADLFDRKLIDRARDEVDKIIEQLDSAMATGSAHGRIDDILWEVGSSLHKTFEERAAVAGGMINVRARGSADPDSGMVDIYKIDRIAETLGQPALAELSLAMRQSVVQSIISRQANVRNADLHIYRNDSVTNTRMLHIDTLNPVFKAFLYLCDVTKPETGPFTYVPGSHREGSRLRRGVAVNTVLKNGKPTNMYVPTHEALQLLAPKGSLIIACQRGVHGGLAQAEGQSRTVMVGRYF